jgi:hypothetical protein
MILTYTICRWVTSFTLLPLYAIGKGSRYPLDRKPFGAQGPSGRCGVEKICYTSWNGTPVVQSVALLYTEGATPDNTERGSVLTWLTFTKWMVRISNQTPAILTKILLDFPQFLPKCAVVVLRLGDNHLLPDHSNSLFTSHPTIGRYVLYTLTAL